MKTILLLAGQSKRFWPLAEKSLFPIAGKPLIAHIVDKLRDADCADIILVGGKHNLAEVAMLYPDFPLVEQEDLKLGMRGALLSALPLCKDEAVLVVSSNDIIDVSGYMATVKAGTQKNIAGAILAQKVSRYFPGGYLSVQNDRIGGIVEKPGAGNEPSDLVNIVCHYHADSAVLLDALKKISPSQDDGYEQALAMLFKEKSYAAIPYDSVWQAVKYPWHLLHMLPILLGEIKKQSIHKTAQIHKTAVIEGNVIIEEGVRVMPHACIVGPAVIGAHSIIGNNALVRGSSIGRHCVIGYNTEVKGSILHNHIWTHSTYLGDSVIGDNVSFGAGTVTGNLRLDEEEIASLHQDAPVATGLTKFGTIIGSDCRIGIHVSISPGIKIGAGSFVASATLIDKDIPEQSFVKMKNGALDVRENSSAAKKPESRDQYKKKL